MEENKGFEEVTIPEAKNLKTGDYLLILESWGTIEGKSDARTNAVYLTQIAQLHRQEGTFRLKEPDKNINFYPKTGSTLGFVSPRDCVIPQKINEKDSKEIKPDKPIAKGAGVIVIIGKKDGINYCVSAKYLRFDSDANRHWIEVSSLNGLKACFPVLDENIFLPHF